MAVLRLVLVTLVLSQPLTAQPPPVPPPIPGSKLLASSRIDGPLEVRAATASNEAVLAGASHTQHTYRAADVVTVVTFVDTYRDALIDGGWKFLELPKVDPANPPDGVVNIAAHYTQAARNLYARFSWSPNGQYEISIADVGEEDWPALLARDCRLTVYSLHFDLDRATLTFESTPTLEKLATLLKTRSAPPVEIQGHMDNVGETGAAERQQLSAARAKAVQHWLVEHGVRAAQLKAKGYGKLRPIAANDTDLGRALNRRIDVACSGQ